MRKKRGNMRNRNKIVISMTIFFIMIIDISLIFNNNVWCDEAASINLSRCSFGDIIKYASMDFHPPLYYFLLKITGVFFHDALWGYKLVSIIPVVITMIVVDKWILANVKNNSLWSAVVFSLLMGLSPCNMGKNVEVRMYTWAALWVTLFLLSSLEITINHNSKRAYISLILSGIAACYTHYFAILTIACISIFTIFNLVTKKSPNLKYFLYSLGGIIIMFIPWVPSLYKQMNSNIKGWTIHLTINFEYFVNSFRYPFEGDYSASFTSEFTIILWGVIVGLSIYTITKLYKKTCSDNFVSKIALQCIGSFVMVVCLAYIISKLFHPILMRRYLFPAISLLWLSVSLMLSDIEINNKERCFVFSLIAIMGLNAYATSRTREYNTGTNDTLKFFNDNLNKGDVLINDLEICACWELSYYLPDYTNYYYEDGKVYENDGITPWYLDSSFDVYSSDKIIWYLCKNDVQIDFTRLQTNGYKIDSVYKGNLDNYYYFTIYKIEKTNE